MCIRFENADLSAKIREDYKQEERGLQLQKQSSICFKLSNFVVLDFCQQKYKIYDKIRNCSSVCVVEEQKDSLLPNV